MNILGEALRSVDRTPSIVLLYAGHQVDERTWIARSGSDAGDPHGEGERGVQIVAHGLTEARIFRVQSWRCGGDDDRFGGAAHFEHDVQSYAAEGIHGQVLLADRLKARRGLPPPCSGRGQRGENVNFGGRSLPRHLEAGSRP